MTDINIEYCVPCGLLEYAVEAQTTLLDEFGQTLDGVRLQPGHGGVFKVHADGDLVWNQDNHDGAIDLDAVTEAVRDHTQPQD